MNDLEGADMEKQSNSMHNYKVKLKLNKMKSKWYYDGHFVQIVKSLTANLMFTNRSPEALHDGTLTICKKEAKFKEI